jgi:hypothetical protein
MLLKDAKELHSGDEVYWNDPDDGLCSRYYTIQTVRVREGGLIQIQDKDGSSLECFAAELS